MGEKTHAQEVILKEILTKQKDLSSSIFLDYAKYDARIEYSEWHGDYSDYCG